MFFENARTGKNQWWRYGLTCVLVVIGFAIGQMPMMYVLETQKEALGISDEAYEAAMQSAQLGIFGLDDNLYMLLILLPFPLAFAMLLAGIKWIHRKPILAVLTGRKQFDLKRFGIAFGWWFGVATCLLLAFMPSDSYINQFDFGKFLILLPMALLLIPIQTTLEEVVFRGYLLQAFKLLTTNKWVAYLVVTIIFASLHFTNPEMVEGGWKMAGAYILLSAFLGFITVKDNGLELATGVHAGNNLFSALILSTTDGAFHSPSIFQTTMADVMPVLPAALLILILSSAAFFAWYFGTEQSSESNLEAFG